MAACGSGSISRCSRPQTSDLDRPADIRRRDDLDELPVVEDEGSSFAAIVHSGQQIDEALVGSGTDDVVQRTGDLGDRNDVAASGRDGAQTVEGDQASHPASPVPKGNAL
jgi:hypothetical protein